MKQPALKILKIAKAAPKVARKSTKAFIRATS